MCKIVSSRTNEANFFLRSHCPRRRTGVHRAARRHGRQSRSTKRRGAQHGHCGAESHRAPSQHGHGGAESWDGNGPIKESNKLQSIMPMRKSACQVAVSVLGRRGPVPTRTLQNFPPKQFLQMFSPPHTHRRSPHRSIFLQVFSKTFSKQTGFVSNKLCEAFGTIVLSTCFQEFAGPLHETPLARRPPRARHCFSRFRA